MSSYALLYNFSGKQAEMLKMVCTVVGVHFRDVKPEEFNQQLGALFEIPGMTLTEEPCKDILFAEEMLVLHGFDRIKLEKYLELLDRMNVGNIPLKAMLTENNRVWSGKELYDELCKERAAFKEMQENRQNQTEE